MHCKRSHFVNVGLLFFLCLERGILLLLHDNLRQFALGKCRLQLGQQVDALFLGVVHDILYGAAPDERLQQSDGSFRVRLRLRLQRVINETV